MISVARRFHRSVSLEFDLSDRHALDGYVVSPLVRDCTARILDELAFGRGRTWALVGPYGSGKSAFALCLASILSEGLTTKSKLLVQAIPDAELRRRIGEALSGGVLPVVVCGDRAPMGAVVLRSIEQSVRRVVPSGRGALLKRV